MTTCLVDANVWLAFLFIQHEHHAPTRRWFAALSIAEAGMCRITQLNVLRLLSNPVIMGAHVLTARRAWERTRELLDDERVEFLAEPSDLDRIFPDLLRYPVPTGKLINDAYLAAFAIASNRPLVTWDRGFQKFSGLRVRLLEA